MQPVPCPRGVKSIFYHVRRARDSLGKAGKWSAAEDEQLSRYVCRAVSSAPTINRASNTELFRCTEAPGLRSQTWCNAHPPTAVIDTVSMYSIRIPNVQVCLQLSAVYI
jgi:hypothetical protein